MSQRTEPSALDCLAQELGEAWFSALQPALEQELFETVSKLKAFTAQEYARTPVFPPRNQLFRAFQLTPLPAVRVVLLGQDPYHAPMQATGLSFSVPNAVRLPPSLKNIYKEITADVGADMAQRSGNLEHWAAQGVLLLNSVLTVVAGQPGAHRNRGWELFTDQVIRALSAKKEALVFLLWGKDAHAKKPLIDAQRHLVLQAPHPSPLSAHRGFFGCRHFSAANAFLMEHYGAAIRW